MLFAEIQRSAIVPGGGEDIYVLIRLDEPLMAWLGVCHGTSKKCAWYSVRHSETAGLRFVWRSAATWRRVDQE